MGFTCYNNWFLPAKDQFNCLYQNNSVLNIGQITVGYWNSTEYVPVPQTFAWFQNISTGLQVNVAKSGAFGVRCIRPLT